MPKFMPLVLRSSIHRLKPLGFPQETILLSRLNQEFGKTIIMVTHNPQAAHTASKTQYLDKDPFSRGETSLRTGGRPLWDN